MKSIGVIALQESCERLQRLLIGFEVIFIPLIEIGDPADGYRSLDLAISKLDQYDWVIFTSRFGVQYFFNRLDEKKRSIPKGTKIAAVGKSTANEIGLCGEGVDLIPETFSQMGLIDAFNQIDLTGCRLLFIRTPRGRDELLKWGADQSFHLDMADAYEAKEVVCDRATIAKRLTKKAPDIFICTSPSQGRRFLELFGEKFLIGNRVYVMGSATADVFKNVDCQVIIEESADFSDLAKKVSNS